MQGKGAEDDDSVEDPDEDETTQPDKKETQVSAPSFQQKQSYNTSSSNDIVSNLQAIMGQTKDLLVSIVSGAGSSQRLRTELRQLIREELALRPVNPGAKLRNASDSFRSHATAEELIDEFGLGQKVKEHNGPKKDNRLQIDVGESDSFDSDDDMGQQDTNTTTSLASPAASRNVHKHAGASTIGLGNENWDLVLHMIFGVRRSVEEGRTQANFEVSDADFTRK